tara:strand:- start:949 stop:1422 length:474 start_codon:yes stop_codon:yes gene_type:complete
LIFISCKTDTVKAKSCKFYPYKTGLKVRNKRQPNLKIYSTSKVKVYFDDFEEIEDAYMEAENNAIVKIARFLETGVEYNKKYFLLNDEKSKISGQIKKEANKAIAKSSFDSKITLSGIKTIKKCYEKNNFVKVTVLLDEKNVKKAKKIKSIFQEKKN